MALFDTRNYSAYAEYASIPLRAFSIARISEKMGEGTYVGLQSFIQKMASERF